MRKIILVAAMVLVSASAQAGGSRSLSLVAANEQQAQEPQSAVAPPAATTQVSEVVPDATAPAYVDRPSAVSAPASPATATTATTQTSTVAATQPASKTAAKVDKPRRRTWTEGRIISELHRHGVYW